MPARFESNGPITRGSMNENGVSHSVDDEIVITGISGRFPESSNIEEFKEHLMNEIDMVTDDDRRWPAGIHGLPHRSGKLKDLSKFDANFFGVHAKQAEVMDPQLRMLLEVTYEAIVDAGVNPYTIRGSRTGVFVGVSSSETDEYWTRTPEVVNGYGLSGCSRAMFSNRLAYAFDFNGPSYSLDTACSSALLSMHQALTAIRSGECDAAIVAGTNLTLKATAALQFHKLGMLSNDGKCKTFDASGDGYVRAETVAVIYLQKLKDARRIYATAVHSKTNTDGYKTEGVTYPNGDMQNQLMREVYNESGINPADVVYVEAHGTGTKIGDPEEVNSIDKLFCKDRKTPLLIGAVKSNMGHSECASGLCSIAKIVIAMEMGVIPANLHFKAPNPEIPALIEGRIRVVNKKTPWNGGIVGINSFGFGGTNVHLILRSNPKPKLLPMLNTTDTLSRLVAVSGRTEEAVHEMLNKAKEYQKDDEFLSLLHVLHKNNIMGHKFRGYAILSDNGISEVDRMSNLNERPIWFIFSGMGSQWPGMGQELLSIEVFHRSLQRSADTLKPYGIDLMDIIMNGTDDTFKNIINSFVTIAAMQVALVDILTSIGIQPDGIVGHSVGELGCAYADGTFTPEQTVLAAYCRGKSIMESDLQPGLMAAVGLSWENVKNMCPPDIIPACHNSADSVTISGPTESMLAFVEELKKKDIFVKLVQSSGFAFHSKYIASAGPKLRASLDKIIPNPKQRSAKWISSSLPESTWGNPLAQLSSSAYHVNNLLSPVLFYEALAHVPTNAITIEIAPHCLLQAILRRSFPSTVTNLSLHKRGQSNNLNFLLSNVGKLYMAGAQPDISKFYPSINFPVGRGTPTIGSLVKWDHSITWEVATFNKSGSANCVVEIDTSKEEYAHLIGHQVDGRIVFPGTGYLVLVWKTFAKLRGTDFERLPVVFRNVRFQRLTIMPKGPVKFSINIFEGTGDFEICEDSSIVASGNICVSEDIEKDQIKLPPLSADKNMLPLSSKDIYTELSLRGYEYHGIFRGIKSCDNSTATNEIFWFNDWIAYMDAMLQISVLNKSRLLYLPSRLQYIAINPLLHKQLVEKLPENDGLPAYYYKNLGITKSGGIEIRGMKAVAVSKRPQTQPNTRYERYTFVPYENSHILVEDPSRGKLHALSVLLQIWCENTTSIKMKIVEVAGEKAAEALLVPLVLNVLYSELNISVDFQIVTVSPENYTSYLSQMNVEADVVMGDVNNASPGQNIHLVIAPDILSNQSYNILKNLVTALRPDGFILLEETAEQFDLSVLKAMKLVLVGKQIDPMRKSYILLKKQEDEEKPLVIQITEKNVSWVNNVKAALIKSDSENQKVLLVSQGEETSGIVGFIKCIQREKANGNVRYIFTQDKNAPDFSLSAQFYKNQLNKGLMANVLKEGQWGTYRHLQLDQQHNVPSLQVEHAYVNTLVRGDLSSLRWFENSLSYYQPNELSNTKFCSVYYAALNFRDIMLTTGKLPPDSLPERLATQECLLGLEFSGRDANGRRVMGMVDAKGLSTTLLVDSDFLWEIPDKWTFEQAATIPVVYLTSYYALCVRGRMKRGETVLIHAGTGGVGQAAISIALHAGCTVFTTVGTPEKREFLKKTFPQLTDRHIGNSRDTSFEQLVLTETQGRGVDIILNSLAEEKLQASLRCLAVDGRFLEIGKYDLSNNNNIGMAIFLKNIAFHGILLDMLYYKQDAEKEEVIKLLSEGIKNGVVRPLPSTVFSEQQLEQAFRFMATGKHIGKVLIKIRDEEPKKVVQPTPKVVTAIPCTYMHPEKSYILIGGLGGFGIEFTNWLITRGAKIIVLVSRSGIRTGYQALCVRRWRENGINIIISTADTTTLLGAERLIEESNRLAPVGGIFNLAVVLVDKLIETLQEADFKTVILPKVNVTRNLDIVSRKMCPLLDYFVVFSSVSSGRGNVGQSNYGLANSAMERMIEIRQANGLPGLAIQWGAIGDVGLLINTGLLEQTSVIGGTVPQRISNCLTTIDMFLQQPHPVLSSFVVAEQYKFSDSNEKVELLEAVSNILGIKDINSVNPSDTLSDLGMDSLMGTEIKQTLERNYDIALSALEIRSLTITKLRDLSSGNSETTEKDDQLDTTNTSAIADVTNADVGNNIMLTTQWPSNEVLLPKQVIVRLKTKSSDGQPLFIVHAIEGLTNIFENLASELERPLWGLQGVEEAPYDTIPELAEFYLKNVKKIQKKGPYHLVGYSFGACVAFEMGLQLESAGEKVILSLIDGSPMYVRKQTENIGKIDLTKDSTSEGCVKALAYFSIQFNGNITFPQACEALKDIGSEIEMFDKMLALVGDTSFSRNDLKIAGYLLFKKLAACLNYDSDQIFNGPITLIKAIDNYMYLEKDYGLSKICKQPVKIKEIAGSHRTMLSGEGAKKIANILQTYA